MTEMKTYHTTLRNAALTLAALPARALAAARALAPALALALSLAACTDTTDPATTTAADDDTRLEGDALALVSPIITRAGDGGDGTTEEAKAGITVSTLVTHLMKNGGNAYYTKKSNGSAAATYIYDATSQEWTTQPAGSEPLRVSVAGSYYMRAVAAATRTDDGTQLIAVTGTPAKTSDTGTGGSASTTGGSVTTPTQAATGTARISEAADGTGSFTLQLHPLSARLVVVLKSVDGTPVTTAHRPQATIAAEGQALKYMALPADTEKDFQLSAATWPEIAGSTSGGTGSGTGSSTGGPAPAKDNAAATQELIKALTVKEEDRQEQTFALVDKDGKLLTAGATDDDATDDATGDAADDTDAAPEARLALSNLAPAEYTSGSGLLFTLLCYGDASGKDQQSYTVAATGDQQLVLRAGCTTTLTLTLGPDGELHVDAITVGGFTPSDGDINIGSGPDKVMDASTLKKEELVGHLKTHAATSGMLTLTGTTLSDGAGGTTDLVTALRDNLRNISTGSLHLTLTDVTEIIANTFNGCKALESVSLPMAEKIQSYAFRNCTALKSAKLPAATEIGTEAFSDCEALRELTFGAIKSWGNLVLYGAAPSQITLTLAAEQMKMQNGGYSSWYAPTNNPVPFWEEDETEKATRFFCGYTFARIVKAQN